MATDGEFSKQDIADDIRDLQLDSTENNGAIDVDESKPLEANNDRMEEDVQFLPISGLAGFNINKRMEKSVCSWWNGPCLFEALDAIEIPPRDPKGSFRMPIIDKFKDMGTVVMGKVESGSISEGDSLLLMPNREMEAIRSQDPDIPDNILHVLFNASNSTTLDNALEVLIRVSKSDEGRSNLTTKGILPFVLNLIEYLANQSAHHPILLALRLLRNLCAGEVVNQNLFIKHDGVKVVLYVVNMFGFDFDETGFMIIRAALQVLANVSLAGNDHQSAIWCRFYPDMFVKIARVRRREICDPLSMVIYTCVDGSVELFADLCKGSGLVAELVRAASEAGFQEDWLKLLLSRLCLQESHFFPLFMALSPDSTPKNPTHTRENNINTSFTSEQAFFLHILSKILNERLREITIRTDFASHVFQIFKSATSSTDFHIRGQSGLPTGCPSLDVLGYSLTLLRDICAGKESDDIVTLLVSWGLLDELLSLLRELELPSSIRTAMKSGENQGSISQPPKVGPYKGFRRDIVGVIGNCAYGRKNVQDAVREKNGILLVLQQCVVDEDNPFLREWGIWSARNLLESNVENQQIVAELEMQATLDVPELVNLGLRVEVDPNTKRAKLVNVGSGCYLGPKPGFDHIEVVL